jgi:hypothetical protein
MHLSAHLKVIQRPTRNPVMMQCCSALTARRVLLLCVRLVAGRKVTQELTRTRVTALILTLLAACAACWKQRPTQQ